MVNFRATVVDVVNNINEGETMSYGDVAALAGSPGAAQAVGRIAAHGDIGTPWHRVIRADGSLAPGFAWGGAEEQRAMLAAEGVEFDAIGRVLGREDL